MAFSEFVTEQILDDVSYRHANFTVPLLATMPALLLWQLAPGLKPTTHLPHPTYSTWAVSLLSFALCLLFDRRRLTPTAR